MIWGKFINLHMGKFINLHILFKKELQYRNICRTTQFKNPQFMMKAHELTNHQRRQMTINIREKYLSSAERNANETVK